MYIFTTHVAGMVVLGDPKAVTCLNLSLAGVHVLLTSSSHYLPIMTSPALKTQHSPQSLKQTKRAPKHSTPHLPCLCLGLGAARVDIMFPMYKNNASSDMPQKVHIHARLHAIRAAVLTIQTLANGMDMLKRDSVPFGSRDDRVLDVPQADSTYHAVSHGEEAGSGSRNMAYVRLDVACSSVSLSIQHISKLVFVVSSWRKTGHNISPPLSSVSSSMSGLKYRPPLLSSKTHRFAWVLVSVADAEVSVSRSSKFTSIFTAFGTAHLNVAKDASGKNSIPVLFGPLDSTSWNKVESFQCRERPDIAIEMSCPGKKLAELLITSPQEHFRGTLYHCPLLTLIYLFRACISKFVNLNFIVP